MRYGKSTYKRRQRDCGWTGRGSRVTYCTEAKRERSGTDVPLKVPSWWGFLVLPLSLSLVSSGERRGGRVKTEEKHRGTRTHMFLGTGCLLHACSTAAATTQLLRTSLRIRKIIQQMYKHAVEFIQLQNETILNSSWLIDWKNCSSIERATTKKMSNSRVH